MITQKTHARMPDMRREEGQTYAQYRRQRALLDKVLRDRLRGRLVTDREWPTWAEIVQMSRECVG